MTQCAALVLWWPHRFDGVADAFYLVGKAVADYREVWWQGAIVIDQKDVLEAFGGVASDVLSYTVERQERQCRAKTT